MVTAKYSMHLVLKMSAQLLRKTNGQAILNYFLLVIILSPLATSTDALPQFFRIQHRVPLGARRVDSTLIMTNTHLLNRLLTEGRQNVTCRYILIDSCCDSLTVDLKGDEFVYPVAWFPYVQSKIHITIDADRDVIISLSRQTHSNDPRYLLVFQEDNTNKATLKRCHSNPPSSFVCEDEVTSSSPTPYLTNGTQKHYWISEVGDDYTVQVGRGGEVGPFLSYTPSFSSEIAIRWIGLGSSVDQRVRWQFCDLVLNEIAQHKPSSQSSNAFEGNVTYDAVRANDYNTNLQLPGLCSKTAYVDIEPWWRVDLQQEYIVKMVRLWNNADDVSHYMEGVTVYVSSIASFTNQNIRQKSKLCGAGSVTRDESEKDDAIIRMCDYAKGRYVYLIKKAPILRLCGVEIFGYQDPLPNNTPVKTSCAKFSSSSDKNGGTNHSAVLGCVITLALLAVLVGVGLFYYAYTRPSSNSGLLLLKITGRLRNNTDEVPVAKYTPIAPSTV